MGGHDEKVSQNTVMACEVYLSLFSESVDGTMKHFNHPFLQVLLQLYLFRRFVYIMYCRPAECFLVRCSVWSPFGYPPVGGEGEQRGAHMQILEEKKLQDPSVPWSSCPQPCATWLRPQSNISAWLSHMPRHSRYDAILIYQHHKPHFLRCCVVLWSSSPASSPPSSCAHGSPGLNGSGWSSSLVGSSPLASVTCSTRSQRATRTQTQQSKHTKAKAMPLSYLPSPSHPAVSAILTTPPACTMSCLVIFSSLGHRYSEAQNKLYPHPHLSVSRW